MNHIAKQIIFLLLSALVGGFLMWWIYRGFNVGLLADFFTQRSNYLWITLVLTMGVFANVLRWSWCSSPTLSTASRRAWAN